MRVVISQPMFFPWVGIFEQLRLADVFVHLDDVQIPRGRSFITRVQLKTPDGPRWLTVPVHRGSNSLLLNVRLDNATDWRSKHLATLMHNYSRAPHRKDMLELVESVYSNTTDNLVGLNVTALESVARYFDIQRTFDFSSRYEVSDSGSKRILELTERVGGSVYITGHGARNYLDHELMEARGVRVEYMTYERVQYPQLHGEFAPHVSILDLIANCGKAGIKYLRSGTRHWKEHINE